MIIPNLRLMCVMGAISLILISCVPKSELAYISIASDRGLCTAWMNMPYTDKRNKHYEAEISERRLNCNTVINNPRGTRVVNVYATKNNANRIANASAQERSQRIGAALQGVGQIISNSSTSTSTISSPNSGVRLLRRRIQTPSIGATDQNLVVYCEYSNGRVIPYYNNVQVQCPAVP